MIFYPSILIGSLDDSSYSTPGNRRIAVFPHLMRHDIENVQNQLIPHSQYKYDTKIRSGDQQPSRSAAIFRNWIPRGLVESWVRSDRHISLGTASQAG